jgi:D-glycerate 3-kinase
MQSDSFIDYLAVTVLDYYERCRAATIVVGLCGAQGSGKSTIALSLANALKAMKYTTVVCSLDDFYLSRAARLQLSKSVHPLLVTRGVPGTHDVNLAIDVLCALAGPDREVSLPRFDKLIDDSATVGSLAKAPAHIVIFEGWCVGAVEQEPSELQSPINELERTEDSEAIWRSYVNSRLAGPYKALFNLVDYLILLKAPNFPVVYAWRAEQEAKLRSSALSDVGTMTDQQLRRFVAHYERLTRHILLEMPSRAELVVWLDENRTRYRISRSNDDRRGVDEPHPISAQRNV